MDELVAAAAREFLLEIAGCGEAQTTATHWHLRSLALWLRLGFESSRLRCVRGCGHNVSTAGWERLVLESKENMAKRVFASADDGDGLALTFARSVAPVTLRENRGPVQPPRGWGGYAPFG